MADSLLSFSASEQFRKKIVVSNLEPYYVKGSRPQIIPKNQAYTKETKWIDVPLVNQPDMIDTSIPEKKRLYTVNQYGPNGGYKADATQWSADMIYLGTGRDSGEKDPTVQALGFGSQIYGARADLIILDDVVMNSNAHEWEKQINWIQKEVITRLGKNGKLLIVGTRIAPNDLYKELRDPKHWSGGRSPFTYMGMPAVLEYAENPKDWKTLWEKSDVPWDGDEDLVPDENGYYPKWDGPTLFKRRSEVTPSTWALVYQQEDVQEDSVFPPGVVQGSVNGARRVGPLKAGAVGHPKSVEGYTVIGLDPAIAGKTALVALTYNRADGRIYILDCLNMSEGNYQKIRAAIEAYVEKYKPQEMRIEINAFQKAFELDDELRNHLAGRGVRLNSHFTGKNKWDTSFGVASMSALFGTMRDGKHQDNNLIELPSSEGSEGIKALVQQLITWKPDTKSATDCVMAMWFAVIRARELIQQNTNVTPYLTNRWATRSQMEKRMSINLDDMYYETRSKGFGHEVQRRIMIGTYVLCHGYYDAYYLQAQKIRRIIASDFQAAFKECDVILGPVAPDVAWRLGEKSKDPVQMYLEDIYTLSTNLAGLPAMSTPCGFNANNLPIGMQLIGNYFSEARLLQIAHQYQQASDWHLRQASEVA